MAQLREMKNSIQMGHFANLQSVLAGIAEGDRTVHVIGHVLGRANGITYRNNPNGDEPSIGVTGQFEATPADPAAPVMVAPVIFLPTAFCKMLEAQLMKGKEKLVPKKAPAKGKGISIEGVGVIDLALEVGIRKNVGASGVGYEFSVVQASGDDDAQLNDPFANLRSLLPKGTTAPAIEAPGTAAKRSSGKRKAK